MKIKDTVLERLCVVLHDAYEHAAVEEGWDTQAKSRVPWQEVPEANKRTMRRAVERLLEELWQTGHPTRMADGTCLGCGSTGIVHEPPCAVVENSWRGTY